MSRKLRGWSMPLSAAALLLAGASPLVADAVVDPGPIAPNPYFTALINGQPDLPLITATCSGPINLVQTAPPVAGQTDLFIPCGGPGVVAFVPNPVSATACLGVDEGHARRTTLNQTLVLVPS
jgi:hypothetical protein